MATKKSRKSSKSASKASEIGNRAEALLKLGRQKIENLRQQPVWERTKRDLQSAVKMVEKRTEKAAERAKSLGQQAALQYQVYLTSHKLQKALAEVGKRVYDLSKAKSAAVSLKDAAALKKLGEARKLDQQIAALQRQAGRLNKKS